MSFGFSLGLVSIFLLFLFITFGVLIRIYSYNKIWFKISKTLIGLFLLIWFILVRYIDNVENFILINNNPLSSQLERSTYYSKVLLLDLCPFMYVALSFCLIFDWNFKITSYISLWSMIGSYITIIGSVWGSKLEPNQTWYNYVFVQSIEGKLYYFIHIVMMTFGTMMFIYCNKYNFKDIINVYYVIISYMIYIVIISKTLNITNNVTGTVEYDWVYGEYYVVHQFFGFSDNNWLSTMFLSYFLVWVLMNILILLRFFISVPSYRFFFFAKMYNNEWLAEKSDIWYYKQINIFEKIFKKLSQKINSSREY